MMYSRIFQEFYRINLRYAVIGGIAVNLYGYPRATGDLDIVLELSDSEIAKFIRVVKNMGMVPRLPVKMEDFADANIREEWINEKNMLVFSVYNPQDPLEHIDIKIAGHEDFERLLKQSIKMRVRDFEISVVHIDDLIEMKKQAGRGRDLDDVKVLEKLRELSREA